MQCLSRACWRLASRSLPVRRAAPGGLGATPPKFNSFRFRSASSVPHLQQSSSSPPPPVPMANSNESFANFDLVKRIKLDFTDVTVSKWRSRVTGLSVVHLDYEGELPSVLWAAGVDFSPAPIVNGYFVIPTESVYPFPCWVCQRLTRRSLR